MNQFYTTQSVGQMLSYYAEQRQLLREKVAVFNFPTVSQILRAVGFKALASN